MRRTLRRSPAATSTRRPSRRFTPGDFFSRMWFSLACLRSSFPFLVTPKRRAAPRWVFIFGTGVGPLGGRFGWCGGWSVWVVRLVVGLGGAVGGRFWVVRPLRGGHRRHAPARLVGRGVRAGRLRPAAVGRGHAAPCRAPVGRGVRLGHARALAGREHGDHVAAVLPGRAVDLGNLGDVGRQPLEQAPAELRVGHLPSAEHDRDLDLVALLEEPLDVALLGLVVVRVDLGPHLHFLEHHEALLAPGLLGLDGLLVLVLRVVHQLADRRLGERCDLDEVEVELVGHALGGHGVHDAELLSVGTHDPDMGGPDPVVDPGFYADAVSLLWASAARKQRKAAKGPPTTGPRWSVVSTSVGSYWPGGEKPSLLLRCVQLSYGTWNAGAGPGIPSRLRMHPSRTVL